MVKKKIDLSDVVLSDQVNVFLKAKTPNTAITYRNSLKRFRKFYGKSIIEFIKEVETQREKNKGLDASERRRFFEEKINEYIEWLKKLGYANNPIRGSLVALQNMFKYYEVPISYSFVKLPPAISKKSNGKHRWKIKEIKKFVDGAKNYRDKALIMVMFQSGLAVGEVCNLNYGDVSQGLESGELPLQMHLVREKNSVEFISHLGVDSIKYLKLYLGSRGKLEDESPLFAKEGSDKRITEGAIQMSLRELAKVVFGINTDSQGVMNPYRPHSFRSAFRSRLAGKTDSDLIKFWMGDNLGPKAGAYLNLPDEEHRDLYSAVEYRLSIESISKDVSGELKETQNIYLKRLTQVEQENASLRRMVEGLVDDMSKLSEDFGKWLSENETKEPRSGPDEPVIEKAKVSEDELKAQFQERKDKMKGLKEK